MRPEGHKNFEIRPVDEKNCPPCQNGNKDLSTSYVVVVVVVVVAAAIVVVAVAIVVVVDVKARFFFHRTFKLS